MKKYISEFIQRGLIASGFGPVILAIIYWSLHQQGIIQQLQVSEVCIGIFSVTALAFMSGGLNVLYQIERLPLTIAILIHGGVLYVSYLATYMFNGWLQQGITPILVFTGIFVIGYVAVWAVIYFVTKQRTKRLNEILMMKRKSEY